MSTAPNIEIVISEGKRRNSRDWTRRALRWGDFLKLLQNVKYTEETVAEFHAMDKAARAEAKDIGGYIGGALTGESRKLTNVAFRQLLILDADYALDPKATWDQVSMIIGCACFMHTTHSHTPEHPRLRFGFLLDRPVDKEEYEALGRMLASHIDIEIFDDTTYQPNRLMFWPSMPKDGQYILRTCDGPPLEVDEWLGLYANWRDMSTWPVSSRQEQRIGRAIERQQPPREKKGLVGAFCRVYDIPGAMEAFLPGVYEAVAEDRYTFTGGSTEGGFVLYDNADFGYSHHGTDPTSGKLVNAFDLVRLHLYGEQDANTDPKTLPTDKPSYAAMQELCRDDHAVLGELEAEIRKAATDDFPELGVDDRALLFGEYDNDYTDQGSALRFVKLFGSVVRYCEQQGGWLAWDADRWKPGAVGLVRLYAMRYADRLLEDAQLSLCIASDKAERDAAKEAISFAKRARSNGKVKAVMEMTMPLVEVEDTVDSPTFDTDPWALNTPSGLVDLRTGRVRDSEPSDMVTHSTRAEIPDYAMEEDEHGRRVCREAVGGEEYRRFLHRVTGGDKAYEDYLQLLAGMALVGKVYEENLAIFNGAGANGKSTLTGVWADVLGTYAGNIRPELLMERRNGTEAFGVEKLRGKRLVLASETDEGARISGSMLKKMASRDQINANPKYGQPFSFLPTHTLIMSTNHLPRLRSIDGGTRRRIAIAPFNLTLDASEVITDYGSRLYEAEGGDILVWMVQGAMRFHECGRKLPKPDAVIRATTIYMDGEDWISTFLDEKCEIEEGAYTQQGALYGAYKIWCEGNGEFCRRGGDFSQALMAKGFEKGRGRELKRSWMRIRLLDDFE